MVNPLVANDDGLLRFGFFVSNEQYLLFALVSFTWEKPWAGCPQSTRAVTAYTMAPQLLESISNGLTRQEAVCEAAATIGRVDLLECARQCVFPLPIVLYLKSAKGRHLVVMARARTHGCPLENDTCSVAPRAGHLRELQ